MTVSSLMDKSNIKTNSINTIYLSINPLMQFLLTIGGINLLYSTQSKTNINQNLSILAMTVGVEIPMVVVNITSTMLSIKYNL